MNMIIKAEDTQFKLSDAGEILFQEKVGNPLPGVAIAVLEKGDSPLAPKVVTAAGHEGLPERIEGWLNKHIGEVLAPLMALKAVEGGDALPAPVKGICDAVYDAMGVIHREELAAFIKDLDEENRAPLRARKVKMGPVLVFLPELNKPAAVRLKAVLWSLYHGEALPPPTPKDGVVSFGIDPESVNRKFHQVVGYPVFGPRAIRIDMLDRVMNVVYDAAAEGKFQAQHQMAEWLGCSIEDLYAILRAMGHKQISESRNLRNQNLRISESQKSEAQKSEAQKSEDQKSEDQKSEAQKSEDQKSEDQKSEDQKSEDQKSEDQNVEGEKKLEVKPELDWFWIKKGKASEKPMRNKPAHSSKPKKQDKPKKKKGERKKKEPKSFEFKAESKPEDNPFAVLQQLKK